MAVKYTRCENGGAGGSRFVDIAVHQHCFSVADGEDALAVSDAIAVASVGFVEIGPDCHESDWRNAPERQFVVVLCGAFESETTDGG